MDSKYTDNEKGGENVMKNDKGVNPLVSGAVGAVVAAGAVAGAMAMANKDTRKKVVKFAKNVVDSSKELGKKIIDAREDVKEVVDSTTKKVKKAI